MSDVHENLQFIDAIEVRPIDSMASDYRVVQAAKVSTLHDDMSLEVVDEKSIYGFINFLMKNRHGSPFEHSIFTWRIKAPIFVWRELMRHRIASYNEQSGRYTRMTPEFYIPNQYRKLAQIGKPGDYIFEEGTPDQHRQVRYALQRTCQVAWSEYEMLLNNGVAKEVARMALPLNIMSTAYVTMNARSLMNFLSLRTCRGEAAYPSFPMREIEMVAEQMETSFKTQMPLTAEAFDNNGRVQP